MTYKIHINTETYYIKEFLTLLYWLAFSGGIQRRLGLELENWRGYVSIRKLTNLDPISFLKEHVTVLLLLLFFFTSWQIEVA